MRAATPVLLLRPLAGTMWLWGAFRDQLAIRHPVIACHHRGAGSSPPATVATSTRTMARDAARLLDHLRTSAYVFGLSLGGMVATWLAIDRPDLVAGLVVASAPTRGTAEMRSLASPRVSAAQRSDGGSLRIVLQHAAAAALHDASHDVGRIAAPTLCVAGGLDELVPPAAIADLARAIPSARFDVIDDAGHDLSLEAPDELARRVSSFFSSLHN